MYHVSEGYLMSTNRLLTTLVQLFIAIPAFIMFRLVIKDFIQEIKQLK